MSYTKSEINNDGGQAGGDAILTNMENGIENALVINGFNSGLGVQRQLITTSLDFSANTAGAACALGAGDVRMNGSDVKAYDPANCGIIDVEYYTTATGVPVSKMFVIYEDLRTAARDFLNMEYCGRKHADISTLTVLDVEGSLDVTLPGHGFPLTLEDASMVVSTGGVTNNTENFGRALYPFTVQDADTIRFTSLPEATWDALIASTTFPLNLYFTMFVFEGAGGSDHSATSTRTLEIYWKTNPNHSTFNDSVFSDD